MFASRSRWPLISAVRARLGGGAGGWPRFRRAGAARRRGAAIDKIFERWDRTGSPGCAVGVSAGRPGRPHQGLRDGEPGVRRSHLADTVFESGSVAKQFTAAAIALLAQDGKLSLDDPVRKYVPELPDFGTPDSHPAPPEPHERAAQPVAHAHAGRPAARRGRPHRSDEILELVSHYKELNFKPGDEYLYNNTGVHAARRHRGARVGQEPERSSARSGCSARSA